MNKHILLMAAALAVGANAAPVVVVPARPIFIAPRPYVAPPRPAPAPVKPAPKVEHHPVATPPPPVFPIVPACTPDRRARKECS